MARVALMNIGAGPVLGGPARDDPVGWVSQIQTKLHCWATADPGRRFDDLFNLVHDPATLVVAWERVARNRGARSAGSDGLTAARIATEVGVPEFLNDLREQLRNGMFVPQPVRERKIPHRVGTARRAAWGSRP